MALKMMSLNSLDKQFIDDNMLTDDDFLCDVEPLELSQADIRALDELANPYKLTPNEESSFSINEVSSIGDEQISLDDILKDYLVDKVHLDDFTNVIPSPTSEVHSPMSNASVISIPEEMQYYEINGTDSPPNTPSGSSDSGIDSPLSYNQVEPVIVTLNSLPQFTYVLPNTHTRGTKPLKPPVTIKPKVVQSNINSVNLNAEEAFVKLPSGVYQVKSPKASRSLANQLPESPVSNNKRKLATDSELIGLCEMALKRQTRIMKNRESASLSRKKKKEYVEKLEADICQMSAENTCLRDENSKLKLRITDLETELFKLKATFSSKGVKKVACFMVVLFIMTLNISPLSNIFDKTPVKPQKELKNHRVGRILLWNEENSSEQHDNTSNHFLKNTFMHEEDSYIVSWEKSYNSSCHQFINKSESIRLENDLMGWVKRVEKKQKQKETRTKTTVLNLKSSIPPLPKLQLNSKPRHENRKDIWAKKKSSNEILIYQTPRKDYEDFFDAINRRDDSFYFVSFSGDHLLLPAIAHNQTMRPRMSFVMPAMTLNDSIDSDNYVSMMQIDCEVMDTKLVYIKESVIPPHLRQKMNTTSKSTPKHATKFSMNKDTKQLHGRTVNLHQ